MPCRVNEEGIKTICNGCGGGIFMVSISLYIGLINVGDSETESYFHILWWCLWVCLVVFLLGVVWSVIPITELDPVEEEFREYIALIHRRYSTSVDEIVFPWLPPEMTKNFYIDLVLLKDEGGHTSDPQHTKGARIGLEELFNAQVNVGDRLLARGRPGVGKTKFCEVVSTKWNEGELLDFCEALIHIPLRKFSVFDDPTLSDLLNFAGELPVNTSSGLQSKIISSGGFGVCFLLDGLDEYHQGYNNRSNYIYMLIAGHKLVNSTVIITSRPRHSWHFQSRATTNVIIQGFGNKEIEQYVHTYFRSSQRPQRAGRLLHYFEDNYHIQHLCYTPLHLMMTVFVFDKSGKLPDTETQMYNFFVLSAFLWDYCKLSSTSEEDCMDSQWSDVSDFPDPFQTTALQLASLAYKGIFKSRTVFSKEDLNSDSDLLKSNLSIVVVDRQYCGFDCVPLMKTLSFPYFTIQEFLAAYHLTWLSTEQQLAVIEAYPKELRFTEVWKFYCGLKGSSDNYLTYYELLNVQYITNEKYFTPLTGHEVWPFLPSARCAFEAQSLKASEKLLVTLNGSIQIDHRLVGHMITPSDVLAFKFVLSVAYNQIHKLTYFPSYSYGPYNTDLKGVFNLLEMLKDVGPLPQLSTFRAINGPLSDISMKLLISKLLSSFPSLEKIDIWISHCSFDEHNPDPVFLSAENAALGKSLATLSKLTNVTFGCIGLGDIGVTALASGVPRPIKLRSIELWGNGIGYEGAVALSLMLRRSHLLDTLDLRNNFLHNNGAAVIAKSLNATTCSCLQELDLSWNSISDDGAYAIAESLKHCHNLRILRLDYNSIGNKGAIYISNLVIKLAKIEILSLSGNSVGYSGATALLQAAAVSMSLKVLELSSNRVSLDNLYVLKAQQFHRVHGYYFPYMSCSADVHSACYSSTLSHPPNNGLLISLAENHITDEGVLYLCKTLTQRVTEINLNDNYISNKGASILAELVTTETSSLEKLSLCGNGIEDKAANVLVEALLTSPSLCYLNMNSNSLGDNGLKLFAATMSAKQHIPISKMRGPRHTVEIKILDNEFFNEEMKNSVIEAAAHFMNQSMKFIVT